MLVNDQQQFIRPFLKIKLFKSSLTFRLPQNQFAVNPVTVSLNNLPLYKFIMNTNTVHLNVSSGFKPLFNLTSFLDT